MTAFTRFIFVLVLTGIVLNLAIVILANEAGARRQREDMARDQALFADLVRTYDDAHRRAEIAIEWQRLGRNDEVLETALVVRRNFDQPGTVGPALVRPPAIDRVIIPGGRVYVDGLALHFDALFPEEFQVLRQSTLRYFDHIYGEAGPGVPQADADRFTLLPRGQVPDAMRLHPEEDTPTFFEIHLWQTLWSVIPEESGSAATPGATPDFSRAARIGLQVTLVEPASRAVRNGRAYVAYLSRGGVALDEGPPGLFDEIMKDAERQAKAAATSSISP